MAGERHVLVIGGGVIGLCCGYFLSKAGYRVTVVNRNATGKESCSDGNAGMIVPSHFTPLAAPGMVSLGLKWMLNRRSPFSIRPRLDADLARWCWQFFRHANRRHVADTSELLRDLSLESRALFEELSEELHFELVGRGLLMLCETGKALEEEREVAKEANLLGIRAEVCSPERLRELDPDIRMNVRGGIWFPQDAHLDSVSFIDALRRGIESNGGRFRDSEVVDFECKGGSVHRAVLSGGERVQADQFVIAGGAWSPLLAKRLGLRLPIQGGKGYSFTLTKPKKIPRLCSLLQEGRVAVTPMGETLRVAGTMEICGNDLSVAPLRLQGIVDSFCRFFPDFTPVDFEGLEPWSGLRPCSPDGLPYVGAVPGYKNAIVATGHAMIGLSLGPVTGKLVSDLCRDGTPTDMRIDPARFC